MVDMLPAYERRCHHQERAFDGADLAEKRCKAICACAPGMSAESIQSLGRERFYVQSASDPEKMYLVDLAKDRSQDLSIDYLIRYGKDCCDCLDWPKARLCKHIAAIAHSRMLVNTVQPTALNAVSQRREKSLDSNGSKSPASVASTVPNLISISRDYLSDTPPSSPGTVHSLWLVESHLTAVLQTSRACESPLPDWESLLPNQRTWTETAEQMGATRPKRSRPTDILPAVPATERIGKLNRKQAGVKNPNPYSGGLRSDKDAAPDARTAAQVSSLL